MSRDNIRDMRAGADVDTLEGKVKLAIAIELDEVFITQGDGKYSLHPMFAKNFGEVRDRLYNAAMRVLHQAGQCWPAGAVFRDNDTGQFLDEKAEPLAPKPNQGGK